MQAASNVYKKIHKVMQDVEYLQKDDKVSFGNTSYKAISEEKVTSAIRASLVKNGLVIVPVEQEHFKDGTLTTVNVKYQITCVETGEYVVAVSSGTGADTQDKGVGKAMTYAYKYLLLRTFAIPTGEDPDKVSSEELDFKAKQQQKQAQSAEPDKVSEAQVKFLSELAMKSGYTRDDKAVLMKNVGGIVGRVITTLFELTPKEVAVVADYLKKNAKGA